MQLLEFLLLVIDLRCQLHDSLSLFLIVLSHFVAAIDERLVIHDAHLLVDRYLLFVLAIRLFQLVVLLVKLVDIIEKLHVLLLCLDEGRDDLVNVVDSCRFHYCLKGLLNDLCIANVLVEQALLFHILVDDRVNANLQNFNRVCKLLLRTLALIGLVRATQAFVVEFDLLVL